MPETKTDLVIVESPAKAKTIEKYLGSKYKVVAGPTRSLYVRVVFNFEDADGETIRELGITFGAAPVAAPGEQVGRRGSRERNISPALVAPAAAGKPCFPVRSSIAGHQRMGSRARSVLAEWGFGGEATPCPRHAADP